MIRLLDTLNISQKDTSEVIFEMSPDYQTTVITDPNRIGVSIASTQQTNSNVSMNINSVNANLQAIHYSMLVMHRYNRYNLILQIVPALYFQAER